MVPIGAPPAGSTTAIVAVMSGVPGQETETLMQVAPVPGFPVQVTAGAVTVRVPSGSAAGPPSAGAPSFASASAAGAESAGPSDESGDALSSPGELLSGLGPALLSAPGSTVVLSALPSTPGTALLSAVGAIAPPSEAVVCPGPAAGAPLLALQPAIVHATSDKATTIQPRTGIAGFMSRTLEHASCRGGVCETMRD